MSKSAVFDTIAPAYADDPDANNFIDLATLRTSQSKFGNKYNLAVALRAAHMITLRDRTGGDGGTITSKSEGSLSVSYSAPARASGDTDLMLTHFGQQLKGLIRGTIVSPTVTGEALNGTTSSG